jgi:hypothetical protein
MIGEGKMNDLKQFIEDMATLSLISKWTGDKGEHTSKLKLIRNDAFVQLWVNNGEKHCGIRLDAAMQQRIIEFLKIKD